MSHLHAKFHIPSARGSLITAKQTEIMVDFRQCATWFFQFLQEYNNLYKSNIFPGDLCTTM
jgi:hypothetical protein